MLLAGMAWLLKIDQRGERRVPSWQRTGTTRPIHESKIGTGATPAVRRHSLPFVDSVLNPQLSSAVTIWAARSPEDSKPSRER